MHQLWQHLGQTARPCTPQTWAHNNPSCHTDPSPSNPPSLVNMVGLHHPQLQPFSAQDTPWSCLGMVVSKDARHTQAATMTLNVTAVDTQSPI
ncbi:hypothetical protein SLA2020_340420 [Shorea laevis]